MCESCLKGAEKSWKRAVFYDARLAGVSTKMHVADCCPVY